MFVAISVTFYFFFINKSNLQHNYAITSAVPEDLKPVIEEYQVELAMSELKEVKRNIIIQKNKSIETEILINPENINLDSQISAYALKPTNDIENFGSELITLKAINSTWIQLRNPNNDIVYSKLMKMDEEYNYSIEDNLLITTGNAGDIIVSIGGNVMGKLGKKGEVLDSVNISPDYFSN